MKNAECRGATKENTPGGSSTEEQRCQTAFSTRTLRAAGLLAVSRVGSVVTARSGDAPTSPPWPRPKSLAAAPRVVFKPALWRLNAAHCEFTGLSGRCRGEAEAVQTGARGGKTKQGGGGVREGGAGRGTAP